MINNPRRKVLKARLDSPYFWNKNSWEVELSCGHTVTAQGKSGQPPKTVGCYKCSDDWPFPAKENQP